MLDATVARQARGHRHPATRLLSLTIGLVLADMALADCLPATPTQGQSVQCTAATTAPVEATGQADITVTVDQGATLTVSGTAIRLGSGTVTNRGQVTATGVALQLEGPGDSVVDNYGALVGATGVRSGTGNDRFNMHDGTVSGGLYQGSGKDVIYLYGGTLDLIDQGDGEDDLLITGGTVTGDIQQGAGVDLFLMDGGTVGSLHQGDGTDSFLMTGGRIIGAFEDGDYAEMTGGTIGRVNMKLEDNVFDMSGGTIEGNLVTGFGNDTIRLSNGYIGGNISVSGGDDSVTITGGTVRGEIRLSNGNDRVDWRDGGVVHGLIDMGEGDDRLQLSNLNQSHLGAIPLLEAGIGTDTLVMSNVKTAKVGRFVHWEDIALNGDSELHMDTALILGDGDTGTGSLRIDTGSSIFGFGKNAAVTAAVAGQRVNVFNAGRIDLSSNASAGDIFTIGGNYVGQGGTLFLNSVLGADNAASDKLVISGGQASGKTALGVLNAGGKGAATVADGIMVVQATQGGTTTPGAFVLNNSLSAGAYQYLLFRGGSSTGSEQNWYLRSTVINPVAPPPTVAPPPVAPPPPDELGPPPPELTPPPPIDPSAPEPAPSAPEPTPPSPPPLPPAVKPPTPVVPPTIIEPVRPPAPTPEAELPEEPNVPIYRVETPVYAVVPSLLRTVSQASLGTFHERLGEQRILDGQGGIRASWVRLVGNSEDQRWAGDARTGFKGDVQGLQVGVDLYATADDTRRHQIGLLGGRTRASGRVTGRALGWDNVQVGQARIDDRHVGLSWSATGQAAGYVDAVILYSDYRGKAVSTRNLGIDVRGDGLTASLEAGKPLLQFGQSDWWLEPQLQVIWQKQSLDGALDPFAELGFDSDDAVTGRIGVRLAADRALADNGWQPYFKLNYWKTLNGTDAVDFNATAIQSGQKTSAWEAGIGAVGHFNRHISAFGVLDYTRDLEDKQRRRESIEVNLGVRLDW